MNNSTDDKPVDARLAAWLVAPLADTGVTPNHLTTLRLAFGVGACGGLAMGTYAWSVVGTLLFVVSHFLDHTDGELARISGKCSPFGHRYDLASDVMTYVLLFTGIGIGLGHDSAGSLPIALGIMAGSAVAAIFHMRHEIERRIGHDNARQPHWGAFEAEDVLYLLPAVALAGHLRVFLVLAAAGAPLFAIWVLREYLALRRAPVR